MSESILYVVSTPIGNLDDMTPRGITVLKAVDVIAAEDTRHSRKLMNHFGIETPMVPCHEHNEGYQSEQLVKRLAAGESVALVSDAGTPLISDPGFVLVRKVREAGFRVVPVPGCCALIAALSVSGLATDRFYFEGFLPAKSSGRKKRLEAMAAYTHTWAVYESTHRILDSLADFKEVLGADRYIVLAREITKTFETVLAGSVEEVEYMLQEDSNQCRGEFVVLVQGAEEEKREEVDSEARKWLERLLSELPPKKAAAIVADMTGYRKKQLYDVALELKG
ncbi:16S rRNA (cytidine(1402)-2'-O)-methyltransferase [Endozoicomonas sp. OPT23]|uniref:16S rRNA (cytidine(1402)-2'-O)-methyltransferase n=1 Tax=Endozoicomonas sp. OPT23 TaxID=2072845 RepID=UPI00129C03E7|nr:16S rRNA (cytidine(1402)-2'-O)-methyltransferase [Endozoicomonas sp. OPT23]MRI35389.1 16S rRNA (cytidine(1402)-2'-O)-methyltransferase [Endozoicomonas sp. OPT23]